MENENGSINPLDMVHVLETIFKFCDVSTLKSARLVSKQWNAASNTSFYERTNVNIFDMEPMSFEVLLNAATNKVPIHMENLRINLDAVYESTGEYSDGENDPAVALEKVVIPYGEHIRSITVEDWEHVSEKLNIDALRELLLTPRRLEELIFTGHLPAAVTTSILFPRPWMEVPPLIHLKKLIVSGRNRFNLPFWKNFLESVPCLESFDVVRADPDYMDVFLHALKLVNMNKLQHIGFRGMSYVKLEHALHFQEAKLDNLKSIHLSCLYSLASFDLIADFLQARADTLEKVTIPVAVDPSKNCYVLQLPKLPHLKYLEVLTVYPFPIYWNLNFINNIANVETVKIIKIGAQNLGLVGDLDDEHSNIYQLEEVRRNLSLRSLVLPSHPFHAVVPRTIESLASFFPNITSLEVQFNDDGLRTLFQSGLMLKKLKITELSEVTDSGLTGTPFPNGDDMEAFADNGNGVDAYNSNLFLGISTLGDLRTFSINAHRGHMSDVTIFHGLIYMPTLREVELDNTDVSDEAVARLRGLGVTVKVKSSIFFAFL